MSGRARMRGRGVRAGVWLRGACAPAGCLAPARRRRALSTHTTHPTHHPPPTHSIVSNRDSPIDRRIAECADVVITNTMTWDDRRARMWWWGGGALAVACQGGVAGRSRLSGRVWRAAPASRLVFATPNGHTHTHTSRHTVPTRAMIEGSRPKQKLFLIEQFGAATLTSPPGVRACLCVCVCVRSAVSGCDGAARQSARSAHPRTPRPGTPPPPPHTHASAGRRDRAPLHPGHHQARDPGAPRAPERPLPGGARSPG